MSKSWPMATLHEVATIVFSGVDKHIIPGEASVRLCNYLDVYRNRRLTKRTAFVKGSATPVEIQRLELRKDDVIITKDSETPDDIGIPSLVEDDLTGVICGYHLALLRPNKAKLVPAFLLHWLQGDTAKRHFLRTANGLTRFGLGSRAVASLPIALPPPNEQADIARILDAVDTALEGTRAAIRRARNLKRASLQRFFYEALGETAYADRPRKKPPKGWALLPTAQLLARDPKNGLSPESSSQPPGVPTFSIAAVRNGRVQLSQREHLKYVQIEQRIAERYRVHRGDILVVRGNANPDFVGAAGVVDSFPEGCIYPDITMRVAFRKEGNPKVLPEFAVLAWNHAVVHNQVLRRAKTSNGTLKINCRDVCQIMMPVPPNEEQVEICRTVRVVDAMIDALSSVGRAQEALKASLMHDLLTGRVRVQDITRVAAA